MTNLNVYFFGRIRLTYDNNPAEIKLTPVIQSLLAYLVLYRSRTHPRYVLANLFWGENRQEDAHHSLNTALWRLRHVLEPSGVPNGTYLTLTRTGEVGINQESPLWLDMAVFDQQMDNILSKPIQKVNPNDIEQLESVQRLYRGDLLEGFDWDWVLCERERLRLKYLNGLAFLMQYYKNKNDFDKSLTYSQQILNIDPLREEIHREVMLLHLLKGQRAAAIRQYKNCESLLAAELGIPPMEETQALYQQILSGSLPARAAEQRVDSVDLQSLLSELCQAAQDLEAAQARLGQAIQNLTHRTNSSAK